MQLKERLEAAIGQPPALPPAESYLPGGTVALRRQRLRACALAVGTAGAVAACALLVMILPGPQREPETSPASRPGSSASNEGHPDGVVLERAPAGYDHTGRLTVAPGWTVTRTVVDPAGPRTRQGEPIAASRGLVVRRGSAVRWVFTRYLPAETGNAWIDWEAPADSGFTDFTSWLDFKADVSRTGSTDQLVAFQPDGTLVARNGVRVIDQVREPDVGRQVRAGASLMAAAHLDRGRDEVWVVAFKNGHDARYRPVVFPVEDYPATLDGLAAYLRDADARGEDVFW